jgi:hypothetical protein
VRRWALEAIASGALTMADIQTSPAATRALPHDIEAGTRAHRRGTMVLTVQILPNAISDLSRLGWLLGARRFDDGVAAAVAEMVERGIALGLRPIGLRPS